MYFAGNSYFNIFEQATYYFNENFAYKFMDSNMRYWNMYDYMDG